MAIWVGVVPVRSVADRKSTRLNSRHLVISYAVFCLKKKKEHRHHGPGPGPRRYAGGRRPGPRPARLRVDLVPFGPLDLLFFFFNDTATPEIYTLSLHDALPI